MAIAGFFVQTPSLRARRICSFFIALLQNLWHHQQAEFSDHFDVA
jgi:hypothetical protein